MASVRRRWSRLRDAFATLARRLTRRTKTESVTEVLQDRLDRSRRERAERSLADELDEIGRRCAKLPVQDPLPADEILEYDENGVPR